MELFADGGRSKNLQVVIISSDKDFAQLVNDNVTVWDTFKNINYNPQKVFKKWGVYPHQMIDYLALCGDASDNIPGVYGIGPKAAQSLLSTYSSLEDIYKNIEKITSKKQKERLLSSQKEAFLSKDLVTIRTDISFDLKKEDLYIKDIHTKELKKILEDLEFRSFQNALLPSSSKAIENENSTSATRDSIKHLTLDEAKKLLNKKHTLWGFILEDDILLGIDSTVFLIDPNDQSLISYLDSLKLNWKGFDLKSFWRKLKFKNPQSAKWSTLLAAYIIFSEKIGSLEYLYEKLRSDIQDIDLNKPFSSAPYQDIYKLHLALESILKEKLKELDPSHIYQEVEIPLLPVLFDMEKYGFLIDTKYLLHQSKELKKEIDQVEAKIYSEAGMDFNISSPKQLSHVLFEKLNLPVIKKIKTGPSTESSVLEALAHFHPIAKDVIEFRRLVKLKSTYVDALPQLVNPQTQRIHTHFNQATVTTGRLSSSSPNLQNIPIKTKMVRQAFIAPKGSYLVSADYSQIELRIMAHLSDDPGLKKAFEDDMDVHAATAKEIFSSAEDKKSEKEKRIIAKAVNFGLAYGQTAFGLSKVLQINQSKAREIIDRYFEKFPNVKTYTLEIIEFAKKHGYVETLFGRRRYIPELNSKNGLKQRSGERAAINAPLQGSASDIVKKAMISLFKEVKSPMILQVHDELVFEVPSNKVKSEVLIIKDIMENIVKLKVPLKVNIKSGHNWDEELETF